MNLTMLVTANWWDWLGLAAIGLIGLLVIVLNLTENND